MTYFDVPAGAISCAIHIIAFASSFVIGASGCRHPLVTPSLIICYFAIIIGELVIAGGGAGVCLGLVFTPCCCLISSYIGRGAWTILFGRHATKCRCHECGHTIPLEHPTSLCPVCHAVAICAQCGYSPETQRNRKVSLNAAMNS